MKKNLHLIGISILIGFLLIGTAYTSVIAASPSSDNDIEKLLGYGSCSTCSGECCISCYEAVGSAAYYAWEQTAPFPKVKWLQPYPLIKFMNDLTLWTADFALELQNGFKETCYQPLFIISEVVLAATQYALKEVKYMLHKVLFIFYPAILAVAFLKAVVYYLKQICDGSTIPEPDGSISQSFIQSTILYYIYSIVQNINKQFNHLSLILENKLISGR